MAREHLVVAGLAGIVVGFALAGLMLARLARTTREADQGRAPRGGVAATIGALLASMLLAAAGVAVVGALAVRRPVSPPAPAPPATEPGAPEAPDLVARGGRALAADPGRLADAREVTWPLLRMRARIPSTWETRAMDAAHLEARDPTVPSTHLLARADVMPAGPTPRDYLASHVDHVREQLATGRIAGFSTRRLGALPGVVTLARRGDGAPWVVTWTGFEAAELGTVSVTVVLGATGADFARDEPLLGAILDGVRFE